MIQRSNTTHGDALQNVLCFDFARPNCVGGEPADKHLTRYLTQFIDAYASRSKWTAFASFVDSHENTNVLAATLDDVIQNFMSDLNVAHRTVFDETMIVLLSYHGLHYDSFLQTEESAGSVQAQRFS